MSNMRQSPVGVTRGDFTEENFKLTGYIITPEQADEVDALREALRETLPYMHRHMRVDVPGMEDDGHVMTFHERDCHEYVDEHHVCVGCELEKRIGGK